MLIGLAVQAVVMTFAVLAAYEIGMERYPGNLAAAQTIAFATLVFSELLRAYTARSERYSVFAIGAFGNKWMQYAVGASLVLMLAVIYVPFLQPVFDTVPLTLADWGEIIPFMLLASIAAELTKFFLRRRAAAQRVISAG
jgi:Ca2+-transporting ATPase